MVVTTTTTSCGHWFGWIALRCDLEQVDKAARPYRHISQTRKWMHQQLFQVLRFGHNQVWTNHTGTRFSTHCKRTPISARTERRRSHATERSPFRVFLHHRRWSGDDRGRDRHPEYRAVREELNAAQKARGFFGMKDAQQITCQSSHTCTRDPVAWTTIHQQETMTQHPHAVADHGRKQHCEICGNRWQRIHLTMVARDPKTKLDNRTVLAFTGKRPVEIG